MSDLPTRTEFENMGNMDKTDWCPDIANAWLHQTLQTAQEWRDSLDMQAASDVLDRHRPGLTTGVVQAMFDAAMRGREDSNDG